jgi:hypothetical protein
MLTSCVHHRFGNRRFFNRDPFSISSWGRTHLNERHDWTNEIDLSLELANDNQRRLEEGDSVEEQTQEHLLLEQSNASRGNTNTSNESDNTVKHYEQNDVKNIPGFGRPLYDPMM